MLLVVQILISTIFFGITGFLVLSVLPSLRRNFQNYIDRCLLSLCVGMALYIFLFMILNAVFKVKINKLSVFGCFLFLCLVCFLYLRLRGVHLHMYFHRRDIVILVLLVLLFALALKVRLINTLIYPDHLVDTDPYRHYIRSKTLLQTGMLSKWEPLIIGNLPILVMQGSYILVSLVSLVSGIDPWYTCKYGSIIVGVLSIMSFYLFIKYVFQQHVPIALASAGFLALSPIHIFRTDIGFTEPYALMFVPLTFLFMLLFVRDEKYEYACLFGLCYTVAAANNLLAGALTAPLLLVYGVCVTVVKRSRKIFFGFALAFALFLLVLLMWSHTYLGVPLLSGGSALSSETGELVDDERPEIHLASFIVKWMGTATLILAVIGFILYFFTPWLFFKDESEHHRFRVRVNSSSLFFILFFFLYFILAFFAQRGSFVIPAARVYRYLTLPSMCLSLFAALACVGCIEGFTAFLLNRILHGRILSILRIGGYVILFLLLAVSIYRSRPQIFWLMGPTEEEFVACDWIREYIPEDAIFVTHWYTGDFVRSLTDRHIVISPRHRTHVAEEVDRRHIDIPLMENPSDMVRFAAGRTEPVYFFKSQYGPWFDVDSDPRFSKVYETQKNSDKKVTIYLIAESGVEDS